MNNADAQIQAFIQEICEKRGKKNFFDRFEKASIYSGGLKLHLDIIDVSKSKPTIVFMPGTNAYAILYGELLTALADNGYNIVGFDPRGHGRSEGERASYTLPELMADMRAAIKYARNRFGNPIVVSGSSQGGYHFLLSCCRGIPFGWGAMSQCCRSG